MPATPTFSPETVHCPHCRAPLPAQAPQGLCPKCLFAGLAGATDAGEESAARMPVHTPEELAPHFPQLEILECLGRGGMGVVYQARQKALKRLVALKLLAPERVTDGRFAQRFTHEAQALAALSHPNIVTIHDFGQAGGFYFLLMEFVDGVNLRQAMKAGRFTPEQALAIVPPVCEALQYAHEHGIVHRDIKPENLLLDKEGRVKIADFGIAKMLGHDSDAPVGDEGPQVGTLASAAGTPQYMAPEQKAHRATDHRADIYSLGVVLYELLTGELPAGQLQPPSARLRGLQIDVRLDEIVLRALEAQPELRYQTAGEFRTQVEMMASGATAPPGVAAAPSRFSRAALAGACWLGWGVLAALWLRTIAGQHVGQWSSMTGPEKLGFVMTEGLLITGFLCTLGTPVLGWVAVAQIRRSAGRLRGLGLAVFEGLLFPLLALDVLVIWNFASRTLIAFSNWQAHAIGQQVSQSPEARASFDLMDRTGAHAWWQGIEWDVFRVVLLAVVIVVDWLIIRAVWRAVNKGVGPAGPTSPRAFDSFRDFLSLGGVGLSLLFGALGGLTLMGGLMARAILLLALLGIVLALTWRRSWARRGACVAGVLGLAIGLAWTPDRPAVKKNSASSIAPSSLAAMLAEEPSTTDPTLSFGPVIERTLTAADANRDGVAGLRFQENELIKPPVAVTGHFRDLATRGFTPELRQWMQAEKVDLLLHLGEKEYDVLTVIRDGFAGQPTEWAAITPGRAAPLLTQMEKLNTHPGPGIFSGCGYRDGQSSVKVFRTQAGLVGYYQLRGLLDVDGSGVHLRYKLVRSGAELLAVAADPPKPGATAGSEPAGFEEQALPSDGWRERFEAVYRLHEGELVKHIRRPFIPERADFYRHDESTQNQAKIIPEPPNYFTFHQDEAGLHQWGLGFNGSDTITLYDVLRHAFALKRYEIEGSAVILALSMEGDWTIREEASTAALLDALAATLRTETNRNISFDRRIVEREAIVARGQPRSKAGGDGDILIYAENASDTGAGGGSGDLDKFLAHVGDQLGLPVVNEVTGGEPQKFSWLNHADANFARMDARLDELTGKVLKNITAQTGITFTREKRPFETCLVTEQP